MTRIYDWSQSLWPASQLWWNGGQAKDGGFTLRNTRIVTPEAGGRAFLEMTFGPMQGLDHTGPLFSWFVSMVQNGNVIRVPLYWTPQLVSFRSLGMPVTDAKIGGGLPWAAGRETAYWSDGTGWSATFGVSTYGSRLEGTTRLVLNMSGLSRGLAFGHLIGDGDHTYMVEEIYYSGNQAEVTVTPPLRRAVPPGSLISFRPKFIGTCLNPESFRAPFRNAGVFQPGSILLGEHLP